MLADSNQVYGCILVGPRNRYLLVQGSNTRKWSFPKGHPTPTETGLQCAHRELTEETNITLPYMKFYEYKLSKGTYFLYNTRTEYYSKPQDCSEIMDSNWFTLAEMQKLSVNIDVNTFIRMLKSSNNMIYWRDSLYANDQTI